ncbi:hypothetical protein C1I95_20380 [Micromonospora craterilacus]|uniref:Uncharacterized protein n=1 Tax=Micromonospora craterilacus TaxID=1655439 RepID=A0A2W2F0H3_9ACTN|nr:hypothetical protein [Micromonospora craterilacus]PZG15067.1 hypothetical protein C1I95_20380 [Micromonospora craterilacus]
MSWATVDPTLTGRQPVPAPPPARPAVPAPQSLMSVIRARLAGAGWHYERDAAMGRHTWTEPVLRDGQREPRTVLVDELFAAAGARVVEACNGHERLVVRCVDDTDPQIVLVTLDMWRMLPDPATTPARQAVTNV